MSDYVEIRYKLIETAVKGFFERNAGIEGIPNEILLYYHDCPLYSERYFTGGFVIENIDKVWEAHFPRSLFNLYDGIEVIVDHEMTHIVDLEQRREDYDRYLFNIKTSTSTTQPFDPHDKVFEKKMKEYSLRPNKCITHLESNLKKHYKVQDGDHRYILDAKYSEMATKAETKLSFGIESYHTLKEFENAESIGGLVKLR